MIDVERFRPSGDRVLLEVLPREDKSPGGLYLPDGRAGRENTARVVAVGPGRRLRGSAARRPMAVAVGDVVVFDPYKVHVALGASGMRSAGSEYARAGEHAIVREDAVLGVVA